MRSNSFATRLMKIYLSVRVITIEKPHLYPNWLGRQGSKTKIRQLFVIFISIFIVITGIQSFSQRLSRKKPTNIQIVGASAKTCLQTQKWSSFYPVSGFSFIQPQNEPRTTLLIFQKIQTPNNSPWASKLWSSNHSKIQRLAKQLKYNKKSFPLLH